MKSSPSASESSPQIRSSLRHRLYYYYHHQVYRHSSVCFSHATLSPSALKAGEMDVLARAGLVDLDEDALAHPRRSPALSSWPVPPPLFLRQKTLSTSQDPFPPSPSTPPPKRVPPNLINTALPPELLLSIFTLLTHSIADHGAHWSYSPSWLSLTHVCRTWRSLALSSPLLWTRISFSRSTGDLANAMLSRSGDAELDIAYGDRLARMPPLQLYTALSPRHLRRTSYLRLNVTRALLAHLAARLPPDAPSLRRLHIDLVDGMHAPGAGHALPGIANLHAGELRVLILDGVPIPSSAPLLTHSHLLTELVISGIPRPARWSVSSALLLLSHTPHLKRLSLIHAIEEDYPDDAPASPLSLVHLERATIHAPTPAVSSFLSSLTASSAESTTRYTLSCAAREEGHTALAGAVSLSLRSGCIERLDVSFGLTEFAVRCYTSSPSGAMHMALELHLEPERVLSAPHSSGRASLLDLMRSPLTASTFENVRRLRVMNDGAICRDDMRVMYRALAGRIEGPLEEFGCHVRDMEYDREGGEEGIGTFLRGARRIGVKIGSWIPDDERFGRTGRDWARGCIRAWAFPSPAPSTRSKPLNSPRSGSGPNEGEAVLEEVVIDERERYSGAALRCLLGLDPDPPRQDAGEEGERGGGEEPPWVVEQKQRRTPVVGPTS
ncbi:unnamed protein product [Peniophora sp. CBMAI 1063]|nr:unnamed protein product [Peniophora sp. CBMAI 1063]